MRGKVFKFAVLAGLVVILPLALGAAMAPRLVPSPQIGIIYFRSDIYPFTAQYLIDQLAYARDDPAIKAVVIVLDSPGGEVSASENLYLSTLHAREVMPVLVSVDWMAASGAYYLAAAADEIYAKPTSLVGNIGVIGYAAPSPYVDEELLTTGPYKAFGGTQAGQVRQMEIAKESFLAAVEAGRGERLNASLDYLSRGEIFSGVQALKLGMIDGLVSTDEVIDRAAELAGLRTCEAVDLWTLTYPEAEYLTAEGRPDWRSVDELPPGLYFRYVELPR